MNGKKVFGYKGENIAARFLENKGYKISKQNYVNKIGEIDIIAQKNDVVIFIEVKSRNSERFGRPREAVTLSKQQKIRRVALEYLQRKKWLNKSCRFDVIEFLNDEITHIENCF